MRKNSLGILSFTYSKVGKAVIYAFVLLAMVLGLSLTPAGSEVAQAASCYRMSVYTMRTGPESKPTVLVYWNKPGHPDANRLKLYFTGRSIRTPSGGTIDTRYPQYNSGGWIGYFIATRWILGGNFLWDQDFRWKAYYC